MKKILAAFSVISVLLLTGCVTDSQNQYSAMDTGRQSEVEFGRIILVRQVKIQDNKSTGAGTLVGGAAGAGIGNAIGHGNARGTGALIGLGVGLIAGAIAEHELQNQKGVEYTITKRNGKTITIVQTIAQDDTPLRRGDRVMIQKSGHYQRVLAANDLPDEVKKPKDVKVVD
jgi:outer membrane lipoprotein SlyB